MKKALYLFAWLCAFALTQSAWAGRSFSGNGDYINTGANTAVSGAYPMSVGYWVKPSSISGSYNNGIVTHKGNSWNLLTNAKGDCGGVITYWAFEMPTKKAFCSGSVLSTGVWTFIAASVTSTNVHLFQMVGSTGAITTNDVANSYTFASQNGCFTIGGPDTAANFSCTLASFPFLGQIAQVMVWIGSNLTDGELQAAAWGGPFAVGRPLSGYWPIYGVDSPEPDLSGKGFNGTVTGTTVVSTFCPCGTTLSFESVQGEEREIFAALPPKKFKGIRRG
jgi:hypothetical protein